MSKSVGRPREDMPVEELLSRIASGRTVHSVTRDVDMPGHDWVRIEAVRNADFAAMLAGARAESAHAFASSVIDISDAATPEDVHVAAKRCDQRRWLAGRYNAAYAEKMHVEATGKDGKDLAPVEIDPSRAALALLSVLLPMIEARVAADAKLAEAATIEHEALAVVSSVPRRLNGNGKA